jgi:hypothetical protein
MRLSLIALALTSVLCTAGPAAAQTPPPLRIPIPYRSYVAINPLGIPFDIGSIEIESGIAQGVTLGGIASYTSLDDDRYTTFDAKVRYYPGEVVLRGFSLGASAGYTHFTTTTCCAGNNTSERVSLDFPTVGLLLDYNWMLGATRRFVLGTGVGAKRVLASPESRTRGSFGQTIIDRAYMTGRFVVGIAF